jgi:hypothetical protein
MKNVAQRSVTALAGVLLAWAAWAAEPKEPEQVPIATVVQAQVAADKEASASQQRINDIDDETRVLLQKYNQLLSEAESMNGYSDHLALTVQSQIDEIALTEKQLVEIEDTAREVMPMMERMLDRIDRFVELDIPFQLEERRTRVQRLKDVMGRADVTISEKYRRIVEAYQIEMDFGRTLEAYDGKLVGDPEGRTVKFLRIGRVTLLYQTLDGKETGYWDAEKKGWVVDGSYRNAVKEGFGVALKQGAPELLVAPVAAPRDAKSESKS